jgi:hypothetical protein
VSQRKLPERDVRRIITRQTRGYKNYSKTPYPLILFGMALLKDFIGYDYLALVEGFVTRVGLYS